MTPEAGMSLPQNRRGATLSCNKSYLHDSCALTRALGHIGSLQRVRNGWTDTWSSY